VVTKLELSNTVKLSVFKLVFVLICTCGHESWVLTERVLSQVLVAEIGFFQTVCNVALHNKVRSCEIPKALDVELLS